MPPVDGHPRCLGGIGRAGDQLEVRDRGRTPIVPAFDRAEADLDEREVRVIGWQHGRQDRLGPRVLDLRDIELVRIERGGRERYVDPADERPELCLGKERKE